VSSAGKRPKTLTIKQPAADKRPNRMLVVELNLGGNLLATGLNGALMDLIRRHKVGDPVHAPLGDFV
jgi:hypothetical protein